MVSEFSKINLTLAKDVLAVGRSEVLVFLYECFVRDHFLTSTYLTKLAVRLALNGKASRLSPIREMIFIVLFSCKWLWGAWVI